MSEPTGRPGVMVSSTFYDLHQHRENLRRFLEDELGYRPLLSEHPSFPINPDQNTVENCRRVVERDADILVLIVGRRYGSLDDRTAKSVTNLEYLAARQKGIPIYAFVNRGIVNLLSVWRRNPQADYSDEVDSTQLFEFVEQIRTRDKEWMQEFETADEIVNALRIQFAYQHRDGLALSARMRAARFEPWLHEVHGEALRITLEQPHAWEGRLFATGLIDAIARRRRLRRRHELGIPLGLGEDVADPLPWLQMRFSDAKRLAAALESLLNNELQSAMGPPGDRERILFVVESIGALYEDALRWAQKVRTANVDDIFEPPLSYLAQTLDDLISRVEQFGPAVSESIERALESIAAGGKPAPIELTLKITVPDGVLEEFQRLVAEAAQLWNSRRQRE